MSKVYSYKRRMNGGDPHLRREHLSDVILSNDACVYCGCSEKLTIDHILPINRGGTNDIYNLVPACLSCNSAKRDKMPLNFICELIRS